MPMINKPSQVTTMESTVDQIRQRFDADVERFSNLDTGQSATIDAPLAMALVAQAAATTPHARHALDVGCGAGNYTLKLLEQLPSLDVTLIDLSQPMLDRATERVGQATTGSVQALRGDIREVELPDRGFVGDIIVGLIGAFLGGLLFGSFVHADYALIGSIVVAFVGACNRIAVVRLVAPGKSNL